MRDLRRLTVLPLLWGMVAGCTPIHRTVRVDDQLLGTREVTDPPSTTALVATATPSADGARVAVAERKLCVRYEVRDVRRLRLHRRDPNRLVLAFEWIVGLGAAGAGGYLTYVDGEPLVSDSVTTDQARYASWGTAAVGGLLLLFAIIDTKLSTDWLEDQGRMSIPSGHRVMIACGEKPAPEVALALKAGGRQVPIGTTAAGEVRLTWASLPPEVVALVEGDEPAKSVAIVALARGEEIGTLPLEAARAARMEQAWAAAAADGTPEAFAEFRRRFPGERGGDGGKGLAESLERELDATAAAALAARDVSRAREVLAWWRAQAPDSVRLAARETELAQVERLGTADGLVGEVDRLLRVAAAKPAVEVEPTGVAQSVEVEALVQATHAVERLEQVAPTDPRLAEVKQRVETARTAKVAALLIDVKRLEKAKDGAGALAAATAATRLAPGDAKVAAAAAGVRRREGRRLAEEARTHARRGDMDAADAALAEAERVAPDDTEVRKTRERLQEQRAEQAAHAARDEKARADATARDEKARADATARDEKARADAAAREQRENKRRADDAARDEKARAEAAAREEKARAEAAAREERENKKRADDAARDEKARAEAAAREEKARAEAAARKELEEKKRAEAEARVEREEQKRAAARAREGENRAEAAAREREKKREQEEANKRRAEDEARAARETERAARESARKAAEERTRGKNAGRKTKNVARTDAPAPPRETTTGAAGTGTAGEVTRASTTTTTTGTATTDVAPATTTTTGAATTDVAPATTTTTGSATTTDVAPATTDTAGVDTTGQVAPNTTAEVAPDTTGVGTDATGDLAPGERARLRDMLVRVWRDLAIRSLRLTLPGTWIASSGNLALTLANDGKADLAAYGDQGGLMWHLELAWRLEGRTVIVGVNGAWAMRGSARITDGQLEWLGTTWARPDAAPTEPAPSGR